MPMAGMTCTSIPSSEGRLDPGEPEHPAPPWIYSRVVDDRPDELHSVFVDWPPGATIDEPEVRFVRQMDGMTETWTEVERIPHLSGPDGLFARIEVVFRRTS